MSKNDKVVPIKLDTHEEKTWADYIFTSEELVGLGREAGVRQTEAEGLDRQLSSIKSDFKGRIETAEIARDTAFRKLRDGREPREYDAVVVYNTPKKGEKSIHHLDADAPNKLGALIRVESMNAGDLQVLMKLQKDEEELKTRAPELDNPVLLKGRVA